MYLVVDMLVGFFILLVVGDYVVLLVYVGVDEVEFVVVVCGLVQVYKVYIDVVLWQCGVVLSMELQQWFIEDGQVVDLYFCW